MSLLRASVAGLFVAVVGAQALAQKDVAQRPPLGWNSWDAYGLSITEPAFRANVSVQEEKLLGHGWTYSVIDEGWFFENPQDRDKPETLRYAIDPYGPVCAGTDAISFGDAGWNEAGGQERCGWRREAGRDD